MPRRHLAALGAAALLAGCGGGGGGTDPGTGGGDPALDLAASVSAPANVVAGALVTAQYTIRNVGQTPALWSVELRFGHRTTPWDALAVVGRNFGLEVLQPGQSVTLTEDFLVDAGLATGDYLVTMVVDGGEDGHPANDRATAQLHVASSGTCSDDALEQDDLATQARPIALDARVERNFCFDPVDWASFEAKAGDRIGLRLESEGAPVVVTVVPPAGTQLWAAVETASPGVPVAGRFTAPADGTYQLRASPKGGVSGAGRGYSLAVHPDRPDPEATALYHEELYWPVAGGVAVVRLDLVNHGFAMTGPVAVDFVLSADEALDPADRRIDRQSFPALADGDWGYDYVHVPIPGDVAPGQWFLLFVVDPDDALAELVEENNVSPAVAVTVVAPECSPDAFEHDDEPDAATPIAPGASQARNHCDDTHDWVRLEAVAGEAFTVDLVPPNTPRGLALRVVAPSGAVVVDAGESYGLVRTFTATETGAYRLEVRGDSFGEFHDYVLSLTRAEPDLTASAMVFGGLVPGGLADVSVSWRNLAATASGPFEVGLFLSRDETLDALDVHLGDVPFEGAARSTNGGRSATVLLPPDLGTGAWFLLAAADPDGVVPELDEANNVGEAWSTSAAALACAPDAYEPDDLPGYAPALILGTPQLRNHCDDRRDWAALQVTTGDPLVVRMDQRTSGAGLEVRLFAADGTTQLASHWDALFWPSDRTGTVYACAGCEHAPGTSAPASYRLTAALCPPDANEPDDAVGAARTLAAPGSATLNGCDGTTDWLVFQAVAGKRYAVAVTSPNALTRPSAAFADATGFPLPVTRSGDYDAPADGPVWIRVRPPMTATLLESDYSVTVTAQ